MEPFCHKRYGQWPGGHFRLSVRHSCVTVPAHIRSRTLPNGQRRHDVQYRRGGRGYKLEHAGTFRTMREAVIRRDLVADWLAAGKSPRRELELLMRPASNRRLATVAAEWLNGRVDLDASTVETYRGLQVRIDRKFGTASIDSIAPEDVNAWIQSMVDEGLAPGTVAGYVRLLRMELDVLDENPARHKTIKLPRRIRKVIEPPDADDMIALLGKLGKRWRPPVVLMEQTGMRISEALSMTERDIDRAGGRVRVRPEVAKRDRPRWIPLQPWYAEAIGDVSGERTSIGNALRRVSSVHPHLLRHRRATLWHQQGIPAVTYASWLGHTKASLSLDTYSHVRPLEECDSNTLLALLR